MNSVRPAVKAGIIRSRSWSWLAGVVIALLLLGGCSLPPQRPAPLVPEDLLWQALAAQQGQYSAWRGMAKIHLDSPAGSRRTNQLLVVEDPDRFRAEVLSMFGQPLLSMTSDGAVLSVSIPSRGEFYRGIPTAANLYRFIRLPLEVDDLVDFLLYDVALIDYRQSRALPGPSLALTGLAGRRQVLDFDDRLRLVAVSYFDADEPVLKVQYADFPPAMPGLPGRIVLEMPQNDSEITIELNDLELDPELSADLFRLEPPAGIPIKPFP